MNLEEVFSVFKKNAGVLGKGNKIHPTDAQSGCIQLFGAHDSWPRRHEASIAGRDG
jgi:hypothetical protein